MNKRNMLLCVFTLSSLFLSSCDRNRTIEEYTIKNDVTIIESNDFSNFSNLKSITFGKNIKSINGSAFANCKKLENVYYDGSIYDWCQIEFQNAKSNPMFYATNFYLLDNGEYKLASEITLPNNLDRLKPYTFAGFNIEKLNLPKNIIIYGDNAFKGSSVENIYFYGNISDWCNIKFENMTSSPVFETTQIYTCEQENMFTPLGDTLYIPSDVYYISDFQFSNFAMVDKIILPNSIKRIGKYAFTLKVDINDKIRSVYYEGDISQWLTISFEGRLANPMEISERIYMLDEANEYYDLTSLDTITIPNGTFILGDYQFAGLPNIDNLYIPSSIKFVGKNVFGNYQLTIENLYFDGNIVDWCNIMFADKYTIAYDSNNIFFKENNNFIKIEERLVVPGIVSELNENVFSGFRKVETIIIEEGIISIGNNSFHNCYNLKEIVIPSSINEIGEDFVYGCSKLERLCYNGDQEHWDIVLKPDVETDVYYYSETQPEENGNYWHFIDSDIAIWE